MWLSSILGSERSRSRRARPTRRASCRLTVELLEDRALPSFLAPVSYPVGVNPDAVAVGDFTGTGIPDLVVANHDSGTVSVLLGKGDGTFQSAQNYAVGGHPSSVAVGDFNNDGKLDIVTANYTPAIYGPNYTPASSTVSVLLGNGNGTFQPALNYVLPPEVNSFGYGLTQNPQSVAVGDFNKDGKLDVAVATYTKFSWYYSVYDQGYVNVLIGDGAGGFTADNSYALAAAKYSIYYYPGHFTSSVAVGDFRGNGNLDLAVAESDPPQMVPGVYYTNGISNVSVLLGNGDGTFGLFWGDAPPYPTSVAVGDFNGDGKLDLVTANSNAGTNGSVSVFLGKGDGTFGTAANYSTGWNPQSIAVADFNRDGKLDLVTANSNGSVSVQLGNGNGTFADQDFAANGTPVSVAVGDFNRDGWPDLAVANGGSASTVSVLLNTAEWRTLAVSGFSTVTTAGAAGTFTVTAYNSDGSIDTAYTDTVHFTSSDPKAVLPADYTFTAADAGVHTFSATLYTAGTQSIAATDTTALSLAGRETGITVNPAAASTMIVAGFPSPITAGVAGSFSVTLKDPYGNLASGYSGTVHFTSSDAKASLPANYTFTAADAGKHTFSAILKTAGTQSITATDTITTTLTGTDGGITVTPAAASRFLITAPSTVTAGVAFTVEDAYGNVVTGYTGTIHFSSTDSTATLPANCTFTAADKGVHTFTGLVLRKKGHQKITITDTLNTSLTASVIVDVL